MTHAPLLPIFRRSWLFFLLLTVGLRPAHGQELSWSPRLQQHVDSLFAAWDTPRTPGTVFGIVYRGELLYQRAYGQARPGREPLTPAHRFWVASMAKQFTAASVALLAEEGRLRLDDDIRRYLPELPWLGDTVRIRHLLHHTSGLRDGFTLIGLDFKGERHYTNANVLRYLSRQRALNFRPGTQFEYNNGGYALLAEIVARAAGQPFAEFAQARIFGPLGMTQTRFEGRVGAGLPPLAPGHAVRYRGRQPHYRAVRFRANTVGSTGLVTTLADLVRWDQNFYYNRLGQGRPELLTLLLTPGQLTDGRSTGYALGLETEPFRGQPAVTHSGADPGYQAQLLRLPRQQLSLICLANTQNFYNLTPRLFQLAEWLLPAVFPAVLAPISTAPANAAALAGIYLQPSRLASVRVVSVQAGQVRAAASTEGYAHELRPLSDSTFANRWDEQTRYAFAPAGQGPPLQLRYQERGGPATTLQRVEPRTLMPAELRVYAGRYYCPELGRSYRLSVRHGRLGLRLYGLLHLPFRAVAGEVFLADIQGHNAFAFQRDDAGHVQGFTLHRDQINGLEFQHLR